MYPIHRMRGRMGGAERRISPMRVSIFPRGRRSDRAKDHVYSKCLSKETKSRASWREGADNYGATETQKEL